MQRAKWHRTPHRRPIIVLRCSGAKGCNVARAARHRTQTARQLAPAGSRNGTLRHPPEDRRQRHLRGRCQTSGMLVATIAQCPMFGGKLESVDVSAVEKMTGVKKVLALEDAVAVIAAGYWPAKQPSPDCVRFGGRENGMRRQRRTICLAATGGAVAGPSFSAEGAQEAEVLAAHTAGMAAATAHLEALYEVPFLAHAPMER